MRRGSGTERRTGTRSEERRVGKEWRGRGVPENLPVGGGGEDFRSVAHLGLTGDRAEQWVRLLYIGGATQSLINARRQHQDSFVPHASGCTMDTRISAEYFAADVWFFFCFFIIIFFYVRSQLV